MHTNKYMDKLYESIKEDYEWVGDVNEIAKFNSERLYFKTTVRAEQQFYI